MLIHGGGPYLTNDGTTNLEPGSTITLQYVNKQGDFQFSNSGTFEQDNVDLLVDWAATSRGSSSLRNFDNSGTWTLQNGSIFDMISSAGWTSFGYGNLTSCSNSGILNVESGSSVAFADLTNTGDINLGSGVDLGTDIVRDPTLSNGSGSTLSVAGSSDASPARFGNSTTNLRTVTLANGTAGSTGAVITIGTGSDSSNFAVQGGNVDVTNNAGNIIIINGGATLGMIANTAADSNDVVTHTVKLTNNGQITLAGQIEVSPNHDGAEVQIDNYGTLTVSGNAAQVERLANRSDGYETGVYNQGAGTINGTGVLTYINSTGSSSRDTMVLTNDGTIAPGNSIGTLEFVNTDVTFSASSVYEFEAASATNHDLLIVTTGDLVLADGWVLDLVKDSGYSNPGETFVLFEVNGGSISLGSFTYSFDPAAKWSGVPSLEVIGNQVVMSGVTLIPEPTSVVLLALTGMMILRRRRFAKTECCRMTAGI